MEAMATVTVKVLVFVEEEDGVFFADCPLLNIVSQGASEEEAVARFEEEMRFLFETSRRAGDLEALLAHRTALRRGERPADAHRREHSKRRYVPADIPAGLLTRFSDAAAAFH